MEQEFTMGNLSNFHGDDGTEEYVYGLGTP